jgi:DNA processing protein
METRALAEVRALTDVSGIGSKRAATLYQEFKSIDAVMAASLDEFDDYHYVGADTLSDIRELGDVVETYDRQFSELRDEGTALIGFEDSRYPDDLREAHMPVMLYARGNTSLLNESAVTFSGSRETGDAGCEWAREVAMQLAGSFVIVSGGALGVDTAAHQGALDASGDTIVVYGTGLDSPYPTENESLFEEVVETGGLLISERPPEAGPDRRGFLQRNQTNAALGDGVVIPAAAESSGTMSQFNNAQDQGRPVFVPEQGLGFTPREGVAKMREYENVVSVSGAEDIKAALNESGGMTSGGHQASLDEW